MGGALDASPKYKKEVDFGEFLDNNSNDSKVVISYSKFALPLKRYIVWTFIVEYDECWP